MVKGKMSMRDKLREQLKERTQESYDSRTSTGNRETIFNKAACQEVGMKFWWASKGDHIIDIIPYFAGDKDPNHQKGSPVYYLDLLVHKEIGPMAIPIVCLEQYGKPCPVCEEARRRSGQRLDYKTEIKPLKPTRRCYYNVVVRDDGKQEKNGVQVLDIAHFFMEMHLASISKNPRTGGVTAFSDPDEGKSISFERAGVGAESTSYKGHALIDRPAPISDAELEGAYVIDQFIELKTYDEIYELFHAKKSNPEDTSQLGQNEDNEFDEDDAPPRQRQRIAHPPQEEVEENDDEEEKPRSRPQRQINSAPKSRNVPDEEVEESDNEETPTCPYGGEFGTDIDSLRQCPKCKLYAQCAATEVSF